MKVVRKWSEGDRKTEFHVTISKSVIRDVSLKCLFPSLINPKLSDVALQGSLRPRAEDASVTGVGGGRESRAWKVVWVEQEAGNLGPSPALGWGRVRGHRAPLCFLSPHCALAWGQHQWASPGTRPLLSLLGPDSVSYRSTGNSMIPFGWKFLSYAFYALCVSGGLVMDEFS